MRHIYSSKKTVWMMLMLLAGILPLAQGHVQPDRPEATITLEAVNVPLKDVLTRLENQTTFRFVYNSSLSEALKQKVSVHARNRAIFSVLNEVLPACGVGYQQVEEHILLKISKKEEAAPESPRFIVTGRVSDQQTGEALSGATVVVRGTTTGATTGADGRFRLNVPDENTMLVISYVGYNSVEVDVKGRTSVDVALTPTARQLSEMVVVGYGSQQKKEVLGAVSTIPTKEIGSRNYNSAAEVLQGTVAGVTVVNEGGDPTASPTIKIRGIGSLNDESPLLVVDGVIYPGTFSSINPNDIQSVSVLKDASAAIYGARASAGVILVTTKKGAAGQVKVNLNYQQGFQQVAKRLKPLDAAGFADAMNTATDNAGLPRIPAFDATINPDSRITKTRWMDEVFQTGKIYNIDASVSGGSEKSTFFFSGGYRKNEGVLLNTFSDRYTFRLNSSHKIARGVTIGENMSYTVNNGQTGNTNSAYTGAILTAIFYPPNATIYRTDGSGRFGGVPEQYAGSYGDLINPVAYLKRLDNRNPVSNVFINPYLEWDILKDLKFRSNWGITQIKNNYKQFNVRITEPGKIFDYNELYQSNATTTDFLNEQTVTYKHTFGGKHNLELLAGHTYQYTKSESFGVKGTGFDNEDPSLRYLKNAKLIVYDQSNVYERGLESYVGRVNYNYGEKYLFSAIIRRDGTSKLLKANRWEWYPSLSAGWNIMEEGFLKDVNWLSNLKLRASWGKIGNLAGLSDYAYSIPLAQTQAMIGATPVVNYGYAETALSNSNLRWETSEQANIGLDLGLLQNRLSATIDVFSKKNKNMLFQEQLPGLAGVPNGRTINAGETENRGIELGLNYQQSRGALRYDVSVNFAYLKNEVRALPSGQEMLQTGSTVRSLPYSNFHMVGQPFGAFFGYTTGGLFQSDEEAKKYVNAQGTAYQPNAKAGDFKFIDNNGDGKIDDKDRKVLGSVLPTKTFSLNGNASYKGFDLNVFFQGSAGNKVFNSLRNLAMNPGAYPGYNMLEDVKDAWSPTNTGGKIPRLRAGSDPNNNFGRISDFYLEDGSYLRLKSLTVGYTVPATVTKSVRARIYLTGQNLLTITKYTGMDPEVGVSSFGLDVGKYPLSRVYMFGVNLSF